MSRRTVLIVDDELNLLRALRDAVRARDWDVDVLTAGNAEEALELMELTAVDVVVSDIRMPGIDGLALIEKVREKYPRSRCLVMTAHVDATSEATAIRLGAVSFIRKPFELDAFLTEVETKLSPRGFRGTSLMGFSLPDILQLVAMNGQGLTFTVVTEEMTGTLVVEGGLLLAAKTDSLSGVEAVFDILAWEGGEITSDRTVDVPAAERLDISLTEVLMKAASRLDEDSREPPSPSPSTAVDKIVSVIEEVEREVGGFLGSIVCGASGGEELGGVKARGTFPREWLREHVPRMLSVFDNSQPDSDFGGMRRMVLELGELSLVVVGVCGGEYLWISAVRQGGAIDALDLAVSRLTSRLEACLGGDVPRAASALF